MTNQAKVAIDARVSTTNHGQDAQKRLGAHPQGERFAPSPPPFQPRSYGTGAQMQLVILTGRSRGAASPQPQENALPPYLRTLAQ